MCNIYDTHFAWSWIFVRGERASKGVSTDILDIERKNLKRLFHSMRKSSRHALGVGNWVGMLAPGGTGACM